MAIVLYVGGSKDGDKGLVPHGFSKSRADTDTGPEIYTCLLYTSDAADE